MLTLLPVDSAKIDQPARSQGGGVTHVAPSYPIFLEGRLRREVGPCRAEVPEASWGLRVLATSFLGPPLTTKHTDALPNGGELSSLGGLFIIITLTMATGSPLWEKMTPLTFSRTEAQRCSAGLVKSLRGPSCGRDAGSLAGSVPRRGRRPSVPMASVSRTPSPTLITVSSSKGDETREDKHQMRLGLHSDELGDLGTRNLTLIISFCICKMGG